jgi:predicted nucleic acid-binding protein
VTIYVIDTNVVSDIDLLVAAVAKRLGGVIVSADADFDALSNSRENWRIF